MKLLLKRLADVSVIASVNFLPLGATAYAIGLNVNATKSISVGIYKTTVHSVEQSSYVLFCSTQLPVFRNAKERSYIGSGFCPGGYGYMKKKF